MRKRFAADDGRGRSYGHWVCNGRIWNCHGAAAGILPSLEGGILPHGPVLSAIGNGRSAGQDARPYGRQAARH